jgi:hypothetical protein
VYQIVTFILDPISQNKEHAFRFNPNWVLHIMFLVSFLQTVIFYSKKIWNETDNIKYDNRDDVNEREFEKNLRDIEVAPFMKGKEHIIEQISTLKTFFDEETKFRSLIKS